MKKILSSVLAFVLICGLAVTAFAYSASVETDKDIIEVGDTVTVTIKMDETIPESAGATMLQVTLGYQDDFFSCEKAESSETYPNLTVKISGRKPEIKFNFFSEGTVATELPAGVIATATFTAKELVKVEALESAFTLDVVVCDKADNEIMLVDSSVSITVCSGHEWVEDYDNSPYATCTEDGEVWYDCSVCDAHKAEPQEAKGHQPTDMIGYDDILDEEGNWLGSTEHYGCPGCMTEVYSIDVYELYPDEGGLNHDATPVMEPGETIRYMTYAGGVNILFHGDNLSAKLIIPGGMFGPGAEYNFTSVDGVVTVVMPEAAGMGAIIEVTNNGTEAASYPVELQIPVGHMDNPLPLNPGDNTIVLEPNAFTYGYTTSFTAACDGFVTFTVTGDYWSYTITSYGAGRDNWMEEIYDDFYYDTQSHDGGEGYDSNTMTIPVKAGEELDIVVSACWFDPDADDGWGAYIFPGSTLTVNVAPAYTHEGHIVAVEGKDPTCTEAGTIDHWKCECCGAIFADEALTQPVDDITAPATGHTYGEWAETKAPTCTEAGEETRTCLCGETETRPVDATGHTYGEWAETKAPTCTEAGEETRTCHCGETETRPVDATGHTYGEWVETKAPTCTTEGEKEHVCASCGHKETEKVPATGHIYGEDGVCTVCGDNPKAGDTTISLVVAAALISALSIVALPVVKKHF